MTAPATTELPVVVIGAGPAGLAAAAHLIDQDIEPLVLEAGQSAGAAVREWAHVRLFSTWSEVVDPAAEKLLAPTGWTRPDPATYPSGGDWADLYLQPLADVLGDRVRTGATVTGVSRAGRDRIVYPHGHRELSHPETGIYLVGMKSYGRAPTFLAMTGFEQVRSVVAAIAGDIESADRVELTLPETGVCGGAGLFDTPDTQQADSGGCCAPTPQLVQLGAPATVGAAAEEALAGGCCGS